MTAGTLHENEPHPAALDAKRWLLDYIARHEPPEVFLLLESFASCSIEGNRLADMCGETLRRMLNRGPVSDRYVLGLCWTLRNMEELSKECR